MQGIRHPAQEGDQTRMNSRQGMERGVSSQAQRKATGIVGRGWGVGPQLETTTVDMVDCIGSLAAMGHARWPWTPSWMGSQHQGWGCPEPCSLPAPGAKPGHLGTEKGHFGNTTPNCFSSHFIDTADFPSNVVPKITFLDGGAAGGGGLGSCSLPAALAQDQGSHGLITSLSPPLSAHCQRCRVPAGSDSSQKHTAFQQGSTGIKPQHFRKTPPQA